MKKYNELDLFASLLTLEKMRMEIIQSIVDLRESELFNSDESYSIEKLSKKRLEALSNLGSYRKLHFENHDKSRFVVHQFSYFGTLPPYKEGHHGLVKQYYQTITANAFDYNDRRDFIEGKAYVFLAHYFENKKQRDLDNRNRKYIIDMLRGTPLINNDTWADLCIFEDGFKDSVPHLQVYLLDKVNKNSFDSYFNLHHEALKRIPRITDINIETTINTNGNPMGLETETKPITVHQKVFRPSLED
ncbi:hypothetical protein ABD87_14720 [Lysinibacillus sphaericus]|uniref:hypothetical protein n=1 Tax=Lysinibacillus sphaericus TaxID=1421 RepID=UPI0018CDEF81|nr:hypothetical protein [Lysinibacillus sphaericus]MBG9730753.1 hypothetical protein [Lysinibacillus sphaericus]